MLTVKVYDTKEDPNHSASLIDDSDCQILGILPRHWPMNEKRIERLQVIIEQVNKANYSPTEVAIALALYGYNVSALERAEKIYKHFDGNCAELYELVDYMMNYGSAPTAMPFPSAEVYVQHALERYGEEAKRRVQVEREVRPLVEHFKSLARKGKTDD